MCDVVDSKAAADKISQLLIDNSLSLVPSVLSRNKKHSKGLHYDKEVHRRQKLTTDFFQTYRVDYFDCEYLNFEKKNMLTVVSRGSFFKGFDNKIIGFVHI